MLEHLEHLQGYAMLWRPYKLYSMNVILFSIKWR